MTPLPQALLHILKADQGLRLSFYDSLASFATAKTVPQLISSQLGEIFELPAPTATQVSATETNYGSATIQITPEEVIGPAKFMALSTTDGYFLAYEEFPTPLSFAGGVVSTITFTNGYIFRLRNVT